MCLDFANIVINPGNSYLIEGKVSFLCFPWLLLWKGGGKA